MRRRRAWSPACTARRAALRRATPRTRSSRARSELTFQLTTRIRSPSMVSMRCDADRRPPSSSRRALRGRGLLLRRPLGGGNLLRRRGLPGGRRLLRRRCRFFAAAFFLAASLPLRRSLLLGRSLPLRRSLLRGGRLLGRCLLLRGAPSSVAGAFLAGAGSSAVAAAGGNAMSAAMARAGRRRCCADQGTNPTTTTFDPSRRPSASREHCEAAGIRHQPQRHVHGEHSLDADVGAVRCSSSRPRPRRRCQPGCRSTKSRKGISSLTWFARRRSRAAAFASARSSLCWSATSSSLAELLDVDRHGFGRSASAAALLLQRRLGSLRFFVGLGVLGFVPSWRRFTACRLFGVRAPET